MLTYEVEHNFGVKRVCEEVEHGHGRESLQWMV